MKLWKNHPLLLLVVGAQHHVVMANLDLAFIIDTSASMQSNLEHLKNAIDGIVASTQGLGTNTRYGLATFEDWPKLPFGVSADVPYRRVIDFTTSALGFSGNVKSLQVGNGNDTPGSQLTAVRQLLVGTPQTADGYAVSTQRMEFRADARKIVILWSDSPFHTPEDIQTYPGPTFASVIANLKNATVDPEYRFVGLNPGGTNGREPEATADLVRLANATGTLATATIDCGAGGGPDVPTGNAIVCTKVGGSVAAVQQGFVNSITNAVPPAPPTPTPPTPNPPTQQPVPAPCFSSSNTVVELQRGSIPIDELCVGDYVETASGAFSRVFSWAHVHRTIEADFLQIYTDTTTTNKEKPLEITPDHLLFLNGSPQRASNVRVGDSLGNSKVVRLETVKRTGLYAPLTEAGELLVSGIRVSSYVDIMNGAAVTNQHMLGHLLFTPVRMVCRAWPDYCAAETHDSEVGYSKLYGWVIRWAVSIRSTGGPLVSWFVTFCLTLLLLPLWAVEEITLRASSSAVLMLVAIAAGAWTVRGREKRNMSKLL